MPANGGFELQDGDINLLHCVHELRLSTIDHLAALSGRSVRALWGRLLKLRRQKYIASVKRFMQKHVYALGPEGVLALMEAGLAPGDLAIKRFRYQELSDLGIRHSLFVTDIHVRLISLTRGTPILLCHWEEGPSLWDSETPAGEIRALPIRPDAYYVLKHTGLPEGKNTFHSFLEADRSTMSHKRMAAKILGYLAYYAQGRYALKYRGMQGFVVNTVTETRGRAQELRKDLHPMIPHAAWREAYPFVAFQDLTLASFLPKLAASDAV